MGINPDWPGYLKYCCDAGLGQYDLGKIDLRGGVEIRASARATSSIRESTSRSSGWGRCRRVEECPGRNPAVSGSIWGHPGWLWCKLNAIATVLR